jgi:hypothetical protein
MSVIGWLIGLLYLDLFLLGIVSVDIANWKKRSGTSYGMDA